jgi:hypothetical protein
MEFGILPVKKLSWLTVFVLISIGVLNLQLSELFDHFCLLGFHFDAAMILSTSIKGFTPPAVMFDVHAIIYPVISELAQSSRHVARVKWTLILNFRTSSHVGMDVLKPEIRRAVAALELGLV